MYSIVYSTVYGTVYGTADSTVYGTVECRAQCTGTLYGKVSCMVRYSVWYSVHTTKVTSFSFVHTTRSMASRQQVKLSSYTVTAVFRGDLFNETPSSLLWDSVRQLSYIKCVELLKNTDNI